MGWINKMETREVNSWRKFSEFGGFKEMVIEAKNGRTDACIGILMFLLISPFLLAFYLIILVGRLIAYIFYIGMDSMGWLK